MNKGRVFKLVFLPLAVGLLVTVGLYLYLQRVQPAAAQAVATVPVVVVKEAIPAKTKLTKEMLTTRPLPADFVSPQEITDVAQAIDKVTTVPLAQGETVWKTKLALPENKTGLAFHIPKGKRALTIKVNEVIGVAGFPEPGDSVDILATFDQRQVGIDKTRLILENVPVLAVSRRTESSAAKAKSDKTSANPVSERDGRGSTLTLAVTPAEAARITIAEERGVLRLMLRPAQGDTSAGETEATLRGVAGGDPAPAAAPKR